MPAHNTIIEQQQNQQLIVDAAVMNLKKQLHIARELGLKPLLCQVIDDKGSIAITIEYMP